MGRIAFGTSGWRGIIAEDFTFTGVRAVSWAIGEHLRSEDPTAATRGVVVGHDTRFLSEAFGAQVARVLAALGVKAFLCQRDTPTPAVAHQVLRRRAAGGVMVTAGHNPPEYNGIEVLAAHGGPALPETTQAIQERANARLAGPPVPEVPSAEAQSQGLIERTDPREAYLAHLRTVVDLDTIRAAGLKVVIDPLYGSGQGYLDTLLREAGCEVCVLHDWRDPRFGGHAPEPTADRLQDLAFQVAETSAHLGLATDGDATRFGLVDADGTFVEPNYFLGLVLRHLAKTRGWRGGVARSVATSHLVDAVARRLGAAIHETPVGFTRIGELMSTEAVAFGGEESAGLSVRGHVPQRDGILACLLAAELVASRGCARLRALVHELYAEVGTRVSARVNYPMEPCAAESLQQQLEQPPGSVAGLAVIQVNRLDGVKMVLEDSSWLLFRTSRTEPVLRLYAEAGTPTLLEGLVRAGEALIRR